MVTKRQIPTPALVLDLDIFEASLTRMAERVAQAGKKLRPHAKAHKCVEIARRQIDSGACGVCVATVPEAELMAKAEIPGLLLTSPLADPLKMARAVATGAMVVVDHPDQVAWYEEAASAGGRTVDVLVDLDVGDHRTGAKSPAQAAEIAQAVDRAPHLRLRGLQGYSGTAAHGATPEDRRRISEAAFQNALRAREALARLGLSAEILTGGSTGTWDIDTTLPEVTELQAGSYVLMDLDYGHLTLPFGHALKVLTTVVSANHEKFVTVDGGFKAFAADRGYGPLALGLPGSKYRWGGDEFGYLECQSPPRLGDRVEFIPPHCDPTVNLHDRIYACRGDTVETVWSIMERMPDSRQWYHHTGRS